MVWLRETRERGEEGGTEKMMRPDPLGRGEGGGGGGGN